MTYTRERRAELLAAGDADAVLALADRVLASGVEPLVVSPPETGLVVLQVREPVAEERFHLGEVLVTSAEVAVGGERGWSMRLGDDHTAALAAALLDAVAATGGELATDVDALCERVELALADAAAAEWADLAPTEVRFEELDQ